MCKKQIKFTCDQCKNIHFEQRKQLDEHLMDKHCARVYQCQLCQQLFDTKQLIQKHFETFSHYSENLQLFCILCDKHFDIENDFYQHVKQKHNNTMNLMKKLAKKQRSW